MDERITGDGCEDQETRDHCEPRRPGIPVNTRRQTLGEACRCPIFVGAVVGTLVAGVIEGLPVTGVIEGLPGS